MVTHSAIYSTTRIVSIYLRNLISIQYESIPINCPTPTPIGYYQSEFRSIEIIEIIEIIEKIEKNSTTSTTTKKEKKRKKNEI